MNERLKKLSQMGAITTCPVAVIVKNKKVLMGLRHYTPDKWKTISVWTLPGGRCGEGEILEEALRREVKEEMGIDSLKILDFFWRGGWSKRRRFCSFIFMSNQPGCKGNGAEQIF